MVQGHEGAVSYLASSKKVTSFDSLKNIWCDIRLGWEVRLS